MQLPLGGTGFILSWIDDLEVFCYSLHGIVRVRLDLCVPVLFFNECCVTIYMGLCCGLHHGPCSCQWAALILLDLEIMILQFSITICMGLCC